MGKIRQLREDQIIKGGSQEHIYPITHARAVYSKDKRNLQDIVESIREGDFLKDDSIKTRHLNDNAVTTSKLGDGSVDNRVLAIDAVETENILDKSVTADKIADHNVTSDKMAEDSVLTMAIKDKNVTGEKLADSAVTTEKIAPRSITTEKIAQGSISRAELTSNVRMSIDKKADAEQVNNSLYELEKKIGERFVIEGDVTNLPDEEDLTSVNVGGTDVLKFKDKAYDPLTYSGMGRKILRKNIVSGVNNLTQSMIGQTDTIYVIQYDFTLGEDITIPENCILEFEGGSISGTYTITGQNTGIKAGLVKIFDINVITKGRWTVDGYHPEWFGAVTDDDTFDCTNAINKAIIMSGNSYGGVVKFVQGIYNFIGPININHKTSLIGSGIGTSILMQMPNSDNHGIYVGLNYSGLRFSNFSIRGRRDNTKSGIYFADRVGGASGQTDIEQKQYAYSEYNDENYSYYPGYKYTIIDNIYIGGFNWGLYLGQGLFDIIVTHCTISENLDRGVIFMASDCEMTDCYINNNGSSGLYVNNGPNKFSNLKVIFNALTKSNVSASAGIYLDAGATGEFFANCETQDNMCKGWHITGINNRFVNCMSETDGHIDDTSHGYQPGYNIYGFYINERIKIGTISGTKLYRDFVKTNVFTNCLVTHRGGITKYDTPVKMVVPYPDIYEGIRIKVQDKITENTQVGTHLFVNPQYIPDYSRLSHNIGNIAATTIDGINYFNLTSATKIRQRIVTSDEMYIYIAMRFDTTRAGQYLKFTQGLRVDALKTDGGSNIEYRIVYSENSYKLAARTKIDDADFVTLLFKKKGNSLYTSAAVKNNDTNDYVLYRKDYHDINNDGEIINYLETNLCLNKLVITNKPIDPTYIIPGSDLSNFRSDALVYISADSPNTNITEGSLTSGTFADKPTVANNSIPVGYAYFCTDRQTTEGAIDGIMIYHKGSDIWVDATGAIV